MNEDSVEDGNYLVRVCAQVMTRDDSKGGWVPMGGGGLSNVSVRKKPLKTPSEDDAKYEYLIFGKRITDQTVVLSCTIKKDFQYNKVMPTFHHWKTGDKKFGLTFQTAADARAFDRGVRQAVEDLLDGNIHSPLKYNLDVAEEDVFMALDLPMERGADSRSSSGSSTNGGSVGVIGGGRPPSTTPSVNAEPNSSSPYTHPHANHHHLHRMHYISKTPRTNTPNSNGSSTNSQNGNTLAGSEQRSKEHEDIWIKHEEKPNNKKLQGFDNDKIEVIQDESLSSYVEFTKQRNRPSVHEYSYPVVDALKMDKRDSITSFKKHNSEMKPPLLPTKTKKKKDRKKEKHKHLLLDRSRCRHCHEMFNEDDNERGSCEFAPDGIRSCINAVTCISCAQCMLYHCMSDAEGDYNHHPCSCNISDENCKKRWIGLTLLSFFVPCLWCYLPLRACHKCGVSCGICGGRHEAT